MVWLRKADICASGLDFRRCFTTDTANIAELAVHVLCFFISGLRFPDPR